MLKGLPRGMVALEPHRIEWEESAREIIAIIKSILKEDIIDAQHIGSTAIRSICAKPIVDIVVGVDSFDRILKYNDILMEKGIIYRGQDQPGQHLYICGDMGKNTRTHHIHAVIWGQKAWNDYVNMRDYLNANEKRAGEYSALKKRLAGQYPEDRNAYTKGKAELIREILQEAAEWRNGMA